jgi:uncharacterized membrane protein
MDAVHEWIEPLFRWAHVVAGVTWIGLLYFFNWINGPFGKAISAETKRDALPQLLPRTLYWFRWGAFYTWVTGVLILVLVYYSYHRAAMIDFDPALSADDLQSRANMAMIWGIGAIVVGVVIYDVLWKAMQSNEQVAVIISFVVLAGIVAALHFVGHLGGRAIFIHPAAMFGSAMAFNVWFRIWPMQRKIIAAIKAGEAPDASWGAMAGLRSKHNTYMSVPLIFMMVSNHFPKYLAFEDDKGWILLLVIIPVSWLGVKFAYIKGASEAPTKY